MESSSDADGAPITAGARMAVRKKRPLNCMFAVGRTEVGIGGEKLDGVLVIG